MQNISIEEYFNLTLLKYGFIGKYIFDNDEVDKNLVIEHFDLSTERRYSISSLESKRYNRQNKLFYKKSDEYCKYVKVYYMDGTEEKILLKSYINSEETNYDEFISLFRDTVYKGFTIQIDEEFNYSIERCINNLEYLFDIDMIASIKRYLNLYFKVNSEFNFIDFSNNIHRKIILPYLYLYRDRVELFPNDCYYEEMYEEQCKKQFESFERLIKLL